MMHKGKCLCGAVTVQTSRAVDEIKVCHCGMCQRWNGGPGFSVDCGDDLHIEGQEAMTTYVSSDWGERAFCKLCGTHLFYHLIEPSMYFASASLFEESEQAKLSMQIYIDSKPQYYNLAEKTAMLTEQDVIKLMSTPLE